MTRGRPMAPEQGALEQFVDAVLTLSEDPGPATSERYLAASRELDESRRSRESPTQSARAPAVRARARGGTRRPMGEAVAKAEA